MREIQQFDAIKLLQRDARAHDSAKTSLTFTLLLKFENVHLKETKRLVCDNEKVTTTACRVKEFHLAHSTEQGITLLDDCLALLCKVLHALCAHLLKLLVLPVFLIHIVVFIAEFIHEEWIDDFHNVWHAGIMHALIGAHLRVYHRLNHRTENVGIDILPVQFAAFDDNLPCLEAHPRYLDMLGEKSSVHVWELRYNLHRVFIALFQVHHVECRIQIGG